MKSDHFDGTGGLLRADFEKVLVVIDAGSFLLWMQEGGERGEGGLLRRCHMIKAAIGDSRIGRVWEEIRGE